jgi:hypothetical protein
MGLASLAPAISAPRYAGVGGILLVAVGLAACGSGRFSQPTGEPRGRNGRAEGQPRYVLRDNGVRCIRAPCFNIEVISRSAGGGKEVVSEVDFSALNLSSEEQAELSTALQTPEGLTVEGSIERGRDEGRVFRVSRVVHGG